jgi:hypothetical protein
MIGHLRRAVFALALATAPGCALLLPVASFAINADTRCAVPESLTFIDTPLPQTARKLAARQPVHLVILGTSSSMPTTKGLPRSYAAGLEAALESRLPGSRLQIDNLSEKTHTADQMAEKLAKTIVPMKPDLVLWQTGNVDAAQQIDINAFSAALEDGIAVLRKAGIDVMLIAPQFRMRLSMMVDVAPYDQVMSQLGSAEEVAVFPRFDIMRHWADNGTFDTRTDDMTQQMQVAEAQNRCIAGLLAEMIAHATKLPAQ